MLAQSYFGGLPIDGIRCDRDEGSLEHVHTSLQIFNRGHAVLVPANIGIPQGASCLYWVHTHDASGVIHIESPVKSNFTLGQFFDIWGPDLSWDAGGKLDRAPRAASLDLDRREALARA